MAIFGRFPSPGRSQAKDRIMSKKEKNAHCGNCRHFLEDIEDVCGMSWCERHHHSVCCTDYCAQWVKENK